MSVPDAGFDTVISGAGISMDPPATLPSGDQLASIAWLSLFDPARDADLADICRQVLARLTATGTGLRLEHLVEVLGRSMPLDVLVRVYELMGSASPNSTHATLASLPRHHHFTLNVDTLLETAGMSDSSLTHLHGRWDRPQSIVTTVSQYLNLLPGGLHHSFTRAIHGRDVLVVGYSGRDFDVFPLLQTHPPRSLRWLVHPGSALEPEVEVGLKALGSRRGCAVDLTPATLFDHLGLPAPPTLAAAPPIDLERAAVGPRAHFARVARSARALGAARVLFEIGALDELEELAARRPCVGADVVWLAKVQARAERRRGHDGRALRLLVKPPRSRDQFEIWRHNGNEVANLISHAGVPALGATMDRLMFATNRYRDGERPRRMRLMLGVRLGQRASVLGRLGRAEALLGEVVATDDLAQLLGPGGQADAITWLLDALKGRGAYNQAIDLLPRLKELTPYTNLSQRAYALWQMGAVEVLCGHPDSAVLTLELADAVSRRSGDGQAMAWVDATMSDALRGADSVRAGQLLTQALSRPSTQNYLARQFLLTQSAEHSRHLGDLDAARRFADQASGVRTPGRVGPRRSSLNFLAIEMVRLMIRAENAPDGDWPTRARKLLGAYERRGARAAAADVRVLMHARAGTSLDSTNFAANGWNDQLDRLRGPWDWRRPWPVIA